jgi:hypothetical protein
LTIIWQFDFVWLAILPSFLLIQLSYLIYYCFVYWFLFVGYIYHQNSQHVIMSNPLMTLCPYCVLQANGATKVVEDHQLQG